MVIYCPIDEALRDLVTKLLSSLFIIDHLKCLNQLSKHLIMKSIYFIDLKFHCNFNESNISKLIKIFIDINKGIKRRSFSHGLIALTYLSAYMFERLPLQEEGEVSISLLKFSRIILLLYFYIIKSTHRYLRPFRLTTLIVQGVFCFTKKYLMLL